MKKSNVRKLLSMTVALSALSMLLVSGVGAEPYAVDDPSPSSAVKEPGALTSPPPQEFNTFGISGSYKYLAAGNAYISAIGNGQISVNADTTANTTVDTIQAHVVLQRYTGTSWVDVTSTNFTRNSTDYVVGDAVFTGIKGFYYRVVCTHSVTKNGWYEQSVESTKSALVY